MVSKSGSQAVKGWEALF